jgi:hypothetical protein
VAGQDLEKESLCRREAREVNQDKVFRLLDVRVRCLPGTAVTVHRWYVAEGFWDRSDV